MTSLVRFAPSTEMRRLQREIDSIFDTFFPTRTGDGNDASAVWSPRVDLAETDEAYHIYLDVPGLSKEELSINYQDGTLSVSGERKAAIHDESTNFVRVERFTGPFYRSFTLPKTINADRIGAHYEHGVLHIQVPKAEESKPRRINIR